MTKKSGKSVEEYRHNIKLLKYHLKKEQKVNETLRYKESKKSKKEVVQKNIKNKPKDQIYSMLDTVSELSQRLKDMGLVLGDVFRMSDSSYDG